MRTVHHGLPEKLLTPKPVKPSYFAFLGRIAPEKGIDRAIRIAEHCGMPLKVAAKVDKADREYFDEQIKPMMKSANVEFIGEINDREKSEFLSGADRAAGSDRLAGAVRPGDDRSHGLRHAGHRLQSRIGAGGDRGRRHRFHRRGRQPAPSAPSTVWDICRAPRFASASRSALHPGAWHRIICRSTAA